MNEKWISKIARTYGASSEDAVRLAEFLVLTDAPYSVRDQYLECIFRNSTAAEILLGHNYRPEEVRAYIAQRGDVSVLAKLGLVGWYFPELVQRAINGRQVDLFLELVNVYEYRPTQEEWHELLDGCVRVGNTEAALKILDSCDQAHIGRFKLDCLRFGRVKEAHQAAVIMKEKLTTEELEGCIANALRIGELSKAALAASLIPRPLNEQDLNPVIAKALQHGSPQQYADAYQLLQRPTIEAEWDQLLVVLLERNLLYQITDHLWPKYVPTSPGRLQQILNLAIKEGEATIAVKMARLLNRDLNFWERRRLFANI